MPRTIRFHLDEHCAHAIAEGLRRRGIDATTSTEAGLLQAADVGHVAFGLAKGRVIFTEDDDFLVLATQGTPHAGIAYCHQQTRSIGEIIEVLTLIWEVCEPEEMANRVEYLSSPDRETISRSPECPGRRRPRRTRTGTRTTTRRSLCSASRSW